MSFSDSHRWASENIIQAAQEGNPDRALVAFKLGAKAVEDATNHSEILLAMGLTRTAMDIYLMLRLTR